MGNASNHRAGAARLATAILVGVFLAQALHGLAVKSGTCDEVGAHLPSGILYWSSGEFSGGLANPPLGQLLVAAGPVITGTAARPLGDDPRDLLPARLPVLLLGLVTVLAVGALGRALGGAAVGVAAAGAAAFSPNLVAHSRLATLDLPVTAFFALTTLAAWRWSRAPSTAGLVAFATLAGTAILVKLTGLHLLPAVAIGACVDGGPATVRLRRAATLVAAGLAGTVVLAALAYGGDPSPLFRAIVEKIEHGRGGHFAYLLGERRTTGFLLYYPVALAVKTPLAILGAAAVGAVALARGKLGGDARGFVAWGVVPAVWIFAAMTLTGVNIGLRHVLPAWPALLTLAGTGIAHLARGATPARVAAGVLAAWAVVAAATITPDHLAYFHELAGGPARGDRILIDSNLDWGQDEGRLRAWIAAQEEPVRVNPSRPTAGVVAANVNAIHGILADDDRRLRWLAPLEPSRTIGHTWRIFRVDPGRLEAAARTGGAGALDWTRWLLEQGRPADAVAILGRTGPPPDDELRKQWNAARAEAALATGDLAGAVRAVNAAGDADLAAEIAHRVSEQRGVPWPERDPRERSRVFSALCRRGRIDEAMALARRVRAASGADPPGFVDLDASPAGLGPAARLVRAARLVDLAQEERALAELGELLPLDPGNEAALGLYGELVVRRKLGLTEFPLPAVDWSALVRRR